MSDRVAIMHKGRIEQIGGPREVYRRPQHAVCRRLRRRLEPLPGASCRAAGDGLIPRRHGHAGNARRARRRGAGGRATRWWPLSAPRRFAPPRASATRCVDGTVTDVSFMGPQTQYTVDAGGLGTAAMLSPADDDDLLHSGAAQQFRFAARSAWLVAADPGRSTAPDDVLAARAVRRHTGHLGAAMATADIAVGARVPHAAVRRRGRADPVPHRPAAGPAGARSAGLRMRRGRDAWRRS